MLRSTNIKVNLSKVLIPSVSFIFREATTYTESKKRKKDYYAILELDANATQEEIKQAYRRLGKEMVFFNLQPKCTIQM